MSEQTEGRVCVNCGQIVTDDNSPCYAHEEATPEWPVFHTFLDAPESGE